MKPTKDCTCQWGYSDDPPDDYWIEYEDKDCPVHSANRRDEERIVEVDLNE